MEELSERMGVSLDTIKAIKYRTARDIWEVRQYLAGVSEKQKRTILRIVQRCGGNELSSQRKGFGVSRHTLRQWILAVEYGMLDDSRELEQGNTAMHEKKDGMKDSEREKLEARIKELETRNLLLQAECDYLKKRRDRNPDRARGQEKPWAVEVMAIKELSLKYGLNTLLAVSGMRRSTYFYRLSHMEVGEGKQRLRQQIATVFHDSSCCYGCRKIQAELARRHIKVDKKTVYAIMKKDNLVCLYRPKRYRHYTEAGDVLVPNTLNRDFAATEPMKKMTTDVTEFQFHGTKLYLSPVLDFFNREILSFRISTVPNLKMVMDMLQELKDRVTAAGKSLRNSLLHSDQGKLYKARAYINFARDNGIERSMSNKGNCYDNSVIECFFGNLKTELGNLGRFKTIEELTEAIAGYIKYYNEKRIQLRLGGLSPVEYKNSNIITKH